MSRWNVMRSFSRRRRSARVRESLRPRPRFAERLEARWLLASDAYVEFNLASNQPGTGLVTDPSLGYAWGIAESPGASGAFAVSGAWGGASSSYSGDVADSPFARNAGQTVDVPLATGQVYNGNPHEFIVHSPPPPPGVETPIGGGPAEFIYASLDGTIYGYNANVGPHAAPAVAVHGAQFTGLTLARGGTADQLYAADYAGGKIDVFDADFHAVTTSGSFTDPHLPDGFKPFNIQALGDKLYVSYSSGPIISGVVVPHGGVVDAFDMDGNFLGRIASGSPLDQPWGMALAPASFGHFAGDLLVANHGDGKINVFDPTPGGSGVSLGALGGADGVPFTIDGLMGLAFGNGENAGDASSLYFTGGSLPALVSPVNGASGDPPTAIPTLVHGLFGTIQLTTSDPLIAVGTKTSAVAGKQFSGALATFGSADLLTPSAGPAASYSASIDWGDGKTTEGSITHTGNGGYLVVGSHTYAAPGIDDYQVIVRDKSGNSATAAGTVQVTSATLAAHALPVASHGLSLDKAPMAAFVDTGGADPLANYSATIDWGDGTTSDGTIAPGVAAASSSAANKLFSVLGSHTYASAGDYAFTITISDSDGSQATVQGAAHVAQAPLLAAGVPVVVASGLSVNDAIVAAFADANGGNPVANYSATIDWGDGSSTSAGTIRGSGNSFIVTGSHDYAAAGTYQLKIALTDQDGSAANVVSHAFINSPVASFVETAFHDVLHRAPDDSGLQYWNQKIAGGLSPAQFASDLAHSAEFYATNVIAPDYQTYLGRAADAAGLAYWTSRMQQGLTDQQLEAEFIASAEFYAHAGGASAAWVDAMYQAVLGRQADSAGLRYWTDKLAAGASRSSVAMGFAASQEREAQIIQQDYFTYLGRSASQAEVDYWVARFEHGATNEDIVSGFVGSSEYFKLHS